LAGPGLPTNIAAGGTTAGHKTHSDTAHTYINKLDTTFLTPSTDGHVLTWDSGSSTAKWEAPTGGSGGGYVNVMDYGANNTGGGDNTTAFANAFATGDTVFVPPGDYVGTFNLDPTTTPQIVGAGWGAVKILPTTGNYFIDANRVWTTGLYVSGITFDGGAGAIRNRYTGSNVSWNHVVTDCRFQNYTGPAISHNASDMPLWKIHRCAFNAANRTTSIGIALNGLTDECSITDCEFQDNRIHIKLGYGGNNAKIANCDFVQYNAMTASNPRAFIWVVPQTSSNNAGNGLVIRDNKMGNENIDAADYRILYADNDTGTYFGDQMPNLSADSTGWIIQHTIADCLVNGSGSFQNPIVYSTVTPDHVLSCTIENIMCAGGRPRYVVEYRTASTTPTPEGATNSISNVKRPDSNFTIFPATNQVGHWQILSDPMGVLLTSNQPIAPQMRGGNRSAAYVNLLQNRINAFTLNTATRSAITDSIGGTDAAEITFPGFLYGYVPTSSVVANMPVWIEFELKEGSSDPLSSLTVLFSLDTAGVGGASNYFRRNIVPPTEWRTYRYLAWSPVTSNSILLKFDDTSGSTGTKVRIGRVRMYHAQEPVLCDLELRNVVTTTTAPSAGGAGALPATPLGYMEAYINGNLRKIAYY
jgi:hypothetical protein